MRALAQFAGGAAVLAATVGLGALGTHLGDEMTASTVPVFTTSAAPVLSVVLAPGRCVEDDPCWTWSRMENRKRGVIDLSTGRRVVVGPCAFRKLWMRGDADLHRAEQRMRGDWWAIHHGCETSERLDRPAIHPSGIVEG